ncbi:hypothetical protein KSP39_PZI017476 [Platanthera zijinensis]|uniref:Uncharacterized protein n=1 Tax=Platanthera zijinensis TaxID=2320716 RepID=A0AAP0B770_9ASPA
MDRRQRREGGPTGISAGDSITLIAQWKRKNPLPNRYAALFRPDSPQRSTTRAGQIAPCLQLCRSGSTRLLKGVNPSHADLSPLISALGYYIRRLCMLLKAA